jgi:glycerol-3-phosphate acyltransferase PlsY
MLHPINWSLALPYFAAAFAFGYLLGSIPFGLLLTRLAGTQDIRSIGSGNIGATNVLRTGRKGLAAATLIGDALKGTAAVLLTYHYFGQDMAVVAALGAFIGHLFPIWLRFKGGKGVATFIGILVAMSWKVALAFGAIWIVVAYFTRYSSLSGLVASAAVPVIIWWLDRDIQLAQLFLLLAALLWFTHRANIMRIVHGTESRIGESSAPKA